MLSSHWAQKLDKDQQLIGEALAAAGWEAAEDGGEADLEKRLRMEPRLLSREAGGPAAAVGAQEAADPGRSSWPGCCRGSRRG